MKKAASVKCCIELRKCKNFQLCRALGGDKSMSTQLAKENKFPLYWFKEYKHLAQQFDQVIANWIRQL